MRNLSKLCVTYEKKAIKCNFHYKVFYFVHYDVFEELWIKRVAKAYQNDAFFKSTEVGHNHSHVTRVT